MGNTALSLHLLPDDDRPGQRASSVGGRSLPVQPRGGSRPLLRRLVAVLDGSRGLQHLHDDRARGRFR